MLRPTQSQGKAARSLESISPLLAHAQVLHLALEKKLGVNLTEWKGTIKSAAVDFMQQMQA